MNGRVTLHVRSLHSTLAFPCSTGLRAVRQDSKFPVPLRARVLSPSVRVSRRFAGRHGSSTSSETVLERETTVVSLECS